MHDSLWGSLQVHVAKILGRQKKAGLLGEWLLVGLMNIRKIGRVVNCKKQYAFLPLSATGLCSVVTCFLFIPLCIAHDQSIKKISRK